MNCRCSAPRLVGTSVSELVIYDSTSPGIRNVSANRGSLFGHTIIFLVNANSGTLAALMLRIPDGVVV